ncbi:hypothetical protein V6N12_028699 [Hibiscus sabdariffa]|uniref:Uncharacterized protein n=1 Tax=Hibiscus sabdariffa TaxID=183260 RepID=A0ABR2F6M9_9ROSI
MEQPEKYFSSNDVEINERGMRKGRDEPQSLPEASIVTFKTYRDPIWGKGISSLNFFRTNLKSHAPPSFTSPANFKHLS